VELVHCLQCRLGVEYWNGYLAYVRPALVFRAYRLTVWLVFALPFFIINCLKLRRNQKIGLVGVFSLGLITMAISVSRFIAYSASNYNIDDASGSKYSTPSSII
jgi:membrane-anchored glycerophosphoryl diester phosphodiesterase (GDPDase)